MKAYTVPALVPKTKVSVITVSLNAADSIETTISSVIQQTYSNIEYIIIDGGSTDGTEDIIMKYRKHIDVFISEPDKGIYDAMNKGVKYATGEWVIFMNAGDTFYDNKVIERVFSKVKNIQEVDLIYGDWCRRYNNFSKIVKAGNLENLWKGMVFSHQSLFTRTDLLKTNPFNIHYKIAADFDFIFRMYLQGKNFFYVDEVISVVSMDGLSNIRRIESAKERWKIVRKYRRNLQVDLYYSILLLNIRIKETIKKILPQKFVNIILKYR